MNMYEFDTIGLIHFLSAITAMFFGVFVVFTKKGGTLHIRMGYIYVAMMVILNVTAFMIYKLMGTFGPFHIAALISFGGIVGGMIPVIRKKPRKTWLEFHYEFMSWSVVGLYAAFWSETFSRFFRFSGFWVVVATATAVTIAVGATLIKMKKKKVLGQFNYYNKKSQLKADLDSSQ